MTRHASITYGLKKQSYDETNDTIHVNVPEYNKESILESFDKTNPDSLGIRSMLSDSEFVTTHNLNKSRDLWFVRSDCTVIAKITNESGQTNPNDCPTAVLIGNHAKPS